MPSSFSDSEHLSSNPSIKLTVMALDLSSDGWIDGATIIVRGGVLRGGVLREEELRGGG